MGQQKQKQAPIGRYNLKGVPEPVGGYAIPPKSLHNARLAVGAVPDPLENDARKRHRVVIRQDLLEVERRRGVATTGEDGEHREGISEGAYRAGKEAEELFERGTRVGCGGQWREGDRVDAATAHELAIIRNTESGRRVNKYLGWLVRTLGRRDTRILSRILGDRMTYEQVAALEGKNSTRGGWYIANRFRDALEALKEAKAAKGPDHHERGSAEMP